ncbi:MAG TPA: efflux RND transporter periplasmic adaptor subunit [Polyangiaceae bacterium]|jgi:membrane fusion protein (multidrug efflux system)|nr:efflux RND transporter periplasmic adaptor subunit [Polyangiaceae bacterium]
MNLRLALLFAFALAACHRETPTAEKPAETPIHVDTVVAAARSVPKEVPLTGVLDANERTDLAANASGRVVSVFVELGARVNKGDKIAQLDARAAALSQAEAIANAKTAADQLATSQLDCSRYQGLLAKGAVTQQEYDRAMGQCLSQSASQDAARARAAQAGQALGDATIRAPFSGKIADRMINVGDYVRPDSKVVTLLSDDPLRVRLTVPEPDIFAARAGVNVRFETLGIPGKEFNAVLKYIGGEVRAQTRDLVVEAIVDNKDGVLLPGMFVTAHLPIGQERLPVVPKSSLLTSDNQAAVFVVVDNRLQHRLVQTGAVLEDGVALESGVKEGERVVVKPDNSCVEGALVN